MDVRMRRFRVVIVVALALAMGWFSTGIEASHTGGATPGASPGASPVASPAASPIAPSGSDGISVDRTSSRFPVSGTAFDLLAPATMGKVSIVASGMDPSGIYAAAVLRNGTNAPVAHVQVGVEARDANGNLVGAGSTTIVQPSVIDPGALATAYLSFNQASAPADAVLTFSVESDTNADADLDFYADRAGVEVTELVVTDSSIMGTLTNPGSAALSDVRLSIACFNGTGALYALEVGTTTQAVVGPGGSSAFSGVLVANTPKTCAAVLITGEGTIATP